MGALLWVGHLTGTASGLTATAATAFFWVRLAYTIVFYFGWPYIRTILFSISWFAVLVIFWEILNLDLTLP